MIFYKTNSDIFQFRVAGISIYNDRVLVHRMARDNFWTLPGGRCDLMEESAIGLKREYVEEIGEEVEVVRPLWLAENFFTYNDENFHELLLTYLVEFKPDSKCLTVDKFEGTEGHQSLLFEWVPIAELDKVILYPEFLKERLQNIPEQMELIVQHSEEVRGTNTPNP